MNARDLAALGFEERDGELRAPAGSTACFVPLEGNRCLRLVIALPTGGVVTAVVAAVALRSEEPAR